MKNITFSSKLCTAALVGMLLAIPATEAFAAGGGRGYRAQGSRREVVVVGHQRYNYRDGRFYRQGWFGFDFFVARPPIGAVITILPFGYRTIFFGGLPYYTYEDIYYRECSSGYIVVPAPVVNPAPVVIQQQVVSGQAVTINVPNTNGSFTPVTLTRHGNGYIGPQGEYYPGQPTVEQLRVLYGR